MLGLLDVAKEAWEEQPSPFQSVVEYVQTLQQKNNHILPIVHAHMERAQAEKKNTYDRPAKPHEFQPGEKVLLLLLSANCKFLARWQGRYTITEKVGPTNHRLHQPGKRKQTELYHINLLKRWVNPVPPVSALAAFSPTGKSRELIDYGEELTNMQRQELNELVDQFQDVFF